MLKKDEPIRLGNKAEIGGDWRVERVVVEGGLRL